MRTVTFGVLLLVSTVVAGCTESTGPSPDLSGEEVSTESDPSTISLTIFTTVYDENDDTDGTKSKTLPDPTPDVIREQFNALNWEDPLHSNSVVLHRGVVNTPDYIKLSISGTLKPRNPDEQMEVQWSELPAGQTVWKHMGYGPIASKEQAIELLVSFLAQDVEYRTAVEWTE